MAVTYRSAQLEFDKTKFEKSSHHLGKPYSQQPGRKRGEGTGYIVNNNVNDGLPPKAIFAAYEKVRVSGVTNMFDVKTVSMLSGLDRDEILSVIKNYDDLMKKYPDIRQDEKQNKIISENDRTSEDEQDEENPLDMPEVLWDSVVEKHKSMKRSRKGINYKTIVDFIINQWMGRDWFKNYQGNEFDLRQELEEILEDY